MWARIRVRVETLHAYSTPSGDFHIQNEKVSIFLMILLLRLLLLVTGVRVSLLLSTVLTVYHGTYGYQRITIT